MRLRHLYTGEMTWRELRVYIRGLPPTSRLRAALAGHPAWSQAEYLLADIFDALASANWQRAGDRTAKRPRRYPRPNPKADPRREAAAAAARERAQAHRAAVEAGHLT